MPNASSTPLAEHPGPVFVTTGTATDTLMPETTARPQRGAARFALWLAAATLLLFPLWFGGVHPGPSLTASLAALLFALVLGLDGSARPLLEGLSRTERATLNLLLFFGAFVALHTGIFSLLTEAHPVLGHASRLPDPLGALDMIRAAATFTALVVAGFVVCRTHSIRRLTDLLLASGILMAMIGLGHWLHDNGRLFHVFEPEHVFSSWRARWPFVNSNHLAGFLLPAAFLCFERLGGVVRSFAALRVRGAGGRVRSFTDVIISADGQALAIRIGFLTAAALALLLALTGTLSRGAWTGFVVGTAVYLLLGRFVPAGVASASADRSASSDPESGTKRRRHRRRHHARIRTETAWPVPALKSLSRQLGSRGWSLVTIVLVALFALFLRDRGAELVEERLAYGLLHSKDDMRWQLVADSLPMIRDHLLFGVGAAGWDEVYPRYMFPLLTGINPVYLHSDPLQLVAELGVTVLVPIGMLVAVLFYAGFGALRAGTPLARLTVALMAGLSALLTASFFDFHFHIPAIAAQTAFVIAALAALGGRSPAANS